MSSFAFVPRKLAKSTKAQPSHTHVHPTHSTPAAASSSTLETTLKDDHEVPGTSMHSRDKGKGTDGHRPHVGKTTHSEEGYTLLISLALSNYALWSDPDMRRTIEWNTEGFIPLSQLFRRSPVLSGISFGMMLENAVVKAVRASAQETLEVRMIVSVSSRAEWYGKQGAGGKTDSGGYEVRRKNWEKSWREYTRDDWERRTVYLENIPPQHRTIPGIARFTLSIISPESSTPSLHRVQHIFLPPHHQDKSDDLPKCKGFALVTLADMTDLEYLVKKWPWDRNPQKGVEQEPDAASDARKFGFRTLGKRRWDQLNQEYLAYRQKLLDEIATFEEQNQLSQALPANPGNEDEAEVVPQRSPFVVDPSSPYPTGCLVFVRNIHPETNKTTLRTLLSAAFKVVGGPDDGLDYVDFNKGMDTCHLRLTTPHHSQILVDYFTSSLTSQRSGLDDSGASPSHNQKLIAMEIVQGKREELYWEKVPQKIRYQAVQKAVAQTPPISGHDNTRKNESTKRRKRKREQI